MSLLRALPMSRIRLAAAQIECQAGDIGANLALHEQAVRQARDSGAGLVVFPELSLTDYETALDIARLAMSRSAPQLLALAQSCIGISAAVGFIESADGKTYNSTALLRDGQVHHIHRKINLPGYGRLQEDRYFSSGDEIVLHSFSDWKLATLICADTWNPALPWLAALNGADCLVLPIASARDAVPEFDNLAGWDINLRHTAMTYGLPIVMCNHCGTRGGLRFWGGSRILGPTGETLVLAGAGPQVIVADVDYAEVTAARRRLPTMQNAAPAFVAAGLQKLLSKRNHKPEDAS